MSAPQQLNFSFDGDRRLRDTILNGQFLFFVEFTPPPAGHSLDSALHLARETAQALAAVEGLFAFTVNDRPDGQETLPALPFALELARTTGLPAILTVSGCGTTPEECRGLLAEAVSKGVANFFATTGRLAPDGRTMTYTDAVNIIADGHANYPQALFGAAVNPYQYLPEGQCLQYAKMLRKLQAGATFITSQFGWDMMKAQELQWFLQKRSLGVPVIARVCFFPQAVALELGNRPVDTSLPLPMAALLINEARDCTEQEFTRRQLARLALQIAGYRKLGYAGCQIAGLREPGGLAELLRLVAELDEALPEYKAWVTRWKETFGCYNFAPTLNPHYLFKDLLEPDAPGYDVKTTRAAGTPLAAPARRDAIAFAVWRRLCGEKPQAFLRSLAVKLYGDRSRFASCAYLNPAECPKGLTCGACGDALGDGTCEAGSPSPCFFHRVLRVLAAENCLDLLEELPQSSQS